MCVYLCDDVDVYWYVFHILCVCVHAHVHWRVYACVMWICVHWCVCVCNVDMCTRTHVMWICVHWYVCVHVCTCTYTVVVNKQLTYHFSFYNCATIRAIQKTNCKRTRVQIMNGMVQRCDRLTSIETFTRWYLNGDGGEQGLTPFQRYEELKTT